MPSDVLWIGSGQFDKMFKAYLRDFYVYQFKEKGVDFKSKGSKSSPKKGEGSALKSEDSKLNLDKVIIDSTFNKAQKRIQLILSKRVGVIWKKETSQKKDADGTKHHNDNVVCITIDSRDIENNPFFELYHFCNEFSDKEGDDFSFWATLLLGLNCGKSVLLSNKNIFNEDQIGDTNNYLKKIAEVIATDRLPQSTEVSWETMSKRQKERFAPDAIADFLFFHPEQFDTVFSQLVENHMNIEFQDDQFLFVSNGHIAKPVLSSSFLADRKLSLSSLNVTLSFLQKIHFLTTKKVGGLTYYTLQNTLNSYCLHETCTFSRFIQMVYFSCCAFSMGAVGDFILDRFNNPDTSVFRFKHNYLQKALNDYDLFDLLYAIKNKKWLFIEYRNAAANDLRYQQIFCYPIEVRESVFDGRQHLIYYHPSKRSVSALRIEFIDNIKIGTIDENNFFSESNGKAFDVKTDLENSLEYVKHTWGTSFPGFDEGNVRNPIRLKRIEIVIKGENIPQNTSYIFKRFKRELRRFAEPKVIGQSKDGATLYSAELDLVSEEEIIKWAKSFIARIVSLKVDGQTPASFIDTVTNLNKQYLQTKTVNKKTQSSYSLSTRIMDELPNPFYTIEEPTAPHRLLFNGLFSYSFRYLLEVLDSSMKKQLGDPTSNVLLEEMVEEYVAKFQLDKLQEYSNRRTPLSDIHIGKAKRIKQAKRFLGCFVKDGKLVYTLNPNSDVESLFDLVPLTITEKQWVNNILHHNLARLFLTDEEIARLETVFPDQKMFDVKEVVLYDQFSDLDGKYDDVVLQENFKKVLNAIQENKKIKIQYTSQYGKESEQTYCPAYFEYTKRENRFRLYVKSAQNKIQILNLERMKDVIVQENESFDMNQVLNDVRKYMKNNQNHLALIFSDEKNTADRILTEFAPWQKTCVKWGTGEYRMDLTYDHNEWKEIVIRILSYGDTVYVSNDDGDVRNELIQRIETQKSLNKMMERQINSSCTYERD